MSELRAAPTEPTEIGFLLALKHYYVKGTTAQPKHTPNSRWLRGESQLYALNMCASSIDDRSNPLCILGFVGIQRSPVISPAACGIDWHN